MQDLMSKLQGILNSEEGQNQLKNIMGMLNKDNKQAPEQTQANNDMNNNFDFSNLANMLSQNEQNENSSQPDFDINMIMKLQQIFKGMNTNDKNSQLLVSLKPHFSAERQKKVDQAISIMRLLSMLPAIKDSGLFNGL